MERLWRLYRNRRQAGNCIKQDPPVFYLCFDPYHGLTGHYLPRVGLLEKYQEVYLGGQKKPLVLFIMLLQNKSRSYDRLCD